MNLYTYIYAAYGAESGLFVYLSIFIFLGGKSQPNSGKFIDIYNAIRLLVGIVHEKK
jgi:hypothetical protein